MRLFRKTCVDGWMGVRKMDLHVSMGGAHFGGRGHTVRHVPTYISRYMVSNGAVTDGWGTSISTTCAPPERTSAGLSLSWLVGIPAFLGCLLASLRFHVAPVPTRRGSIVAYPRHWRFDGLAFGRDLRGHPARRVTPGGWGALLRPMSQPDPAGQGTWATCQASLGERIRYNVLPT